MTALVAGLQGTGGSSAASSIEHGLFTHKNAVSRYENAAGHCA